jgi:hypothetical protein
MNCQVRPRLVFRRNCFGVVGPTRVAHLMARTRPVDRTGLGLLPSTRVNREAVAWGASDEPGHGSREIARLPHVGGSAI